VNEVVPISAGLYVTRFGSARAPLIPAMENAGLMVQIEAERKLTRPDCFIAGLQEENTMKNNSYEMAYREARAVLFRRGKSVGRPITREDGLRQCRVDGFPMTDAAVFTEAWDQRLAEELLRERIPPAVFEHHA
jgi:hypothetical protein